MKNNAKLILEGAQQLGVCVSEDQISNFLIYLDELKQWNARINLTAIRDDRGIIIRHFLDSIAGMAALGKGVSSGVPTRIIDVGTGAGFPGLPIKICRHQIFLTLLESNKKKVAFLHSLCGTLGLKGIQILAERLERIATQPSHQGAYDILMARALRPSMFLGRASSLLCPGGRVIIWTARAGEELFRELKDPAVWSPPEVLSYRLPFEGIERNLIVLRKAFHS
ncbi:MAG: 16S rRNA (guanine(527)-N(7))-methyltransferase RsmG [Nitrospiria bacterium]